MPAVTEVMRADFSRILTTSHILAIRTFQFDLIDLRPTLTVTQGADLVERVQVMRSVRLHLLRGTSTIPTQVACWQGAEPVRVPLC